MQPRNPPLDFEFLKAVADSLRLANGRDPTVEELAKACVVLTDLAAAMHDPDLVPPLTGYYWCGLPTSPDLAVGAIYPDDYLKPPLTLEVVK